MIALVTDSTSDLSAAQLAELGITSVPLYVLFKGENLKDGIEITTHELFAGIRSGAKIPSTSQPSPIEFAHVYRQLLSKGVTEIISIHISSLLSGTVQSARLAAAEFEGKVTVIDSQTATGGIVLQLQRARDMIQSGQSVAEIVDALQRSQAKMTLRFAVDTLEYLKLNGRIGGAQAMLGGLLGIKPMLQVFNGRVEAAGKVRGRSKAIAHIIECAREYVKKHGDTRIIYLYTEGGDIVIPELREALNGLALTECGVLDIGAVVAAHTGPQVFGIAMEPK